MQYTKIQKLIAFTIGLVMLMELVDSSVLNTSLPQVAYSLRVNPIDLKVAVTIYLLTLGMFIPAATWVADRFGVRKILTIAIVGFLLASIGCGLAINLPMLVVFRALQGICGAFVMPIGRLVLVRTFNDSMTQAMTRVATIVIMGPMFGPLIGGTLTTFASWRLIFFINIPIGIFAIWSINKFFPSTRQPVQHRFDVMGFLMLAFAFFIMLAALDGVLLKGDLWLKAGVFAFGLLLLIAYFFYGRRREHPIVRLELFKLGAFKFLALVSMSLRLFAAGFGFLFPLYLQTTQGYSAFSASLAMIPFVVGAFIAKRSVARVLRLLQFKKAFLFMVAGVILASLWSSFIFASFNLSAFLVMAFFYGLFWGVFTTVNNSAAYKSLSPENMASGTTVMSAIVQLSASFAVSLLALLLMSSAGVHQLAWDQALPVHAFQFALWVCSAGLLIVWIYIWFAPRELSLMSVS